MDYLILSALAAFCITIGCIVMLTPLAIRIGLVDAPGGRKKHEGEIPLIGGIAMLVGFALAVLPLPIFLHPYRSLFAACAMVVFFGVLDDFHELNAKLKLLMQIFVALLIAVWGDKVLRDLGDIFLLGDFNLGRWAMPFTVFAVVGVTNMMNMIDGIDGLAGGISLVSLAFMLVLAFFTGQFIDAQLITVLLAVVLGFLCFNFPITKKRRAKVFMGDAGSLFLGFIIAWFAISLSQSHMGVKPVVMLWVLALPLFDTLYLIISRLLRGQSPMSADRCHLHHILQAYGLSSRLTSMVMIFLTAMFAAVGLWGQLHNISAGILFYSLLSLFVLYYILGSFAWLKLQSSASTAGITP